MRRLSENAKRVGCAMLVASSVWVGGAQDVEARGEYVNQIPNGSFYTCDTCHIGRRREENFNVFGDQILAALDGTTIRWGDVYDLDADGDGFSNGAELGDPRGVYSLGSSPEGPYFSDPWDEFSVPFCGNGERDSIAPVSEQCDGEVEMTCEVIGGVASERPACTEFCMLDYDACVTFPDPDMGTPPEDMGMMIVDMGAPPEDMSSEVDMGASAVDMGAPPLDMESPCSLDMGAEVVGPVETMDEGVPDFQLEGESFMCTSPGHDRAPQSWPLWFVLGVAVFRRSRT